jgi:hypothetical protein
MDAGSRLQESKASLAKCPMLRRVNHEDADDDIGGGKFVDVHGAVCKDAERYQAG